MTNDSFTLKGHAVMLAAVASAYPMMGYAAPAARVDFTVGNVTAVGANGKSRTLAKGAQIEQGDMVNTNNGRAQLRFTDGAYVSLQPDSQFRVDQYNFSGKADGKEKGFFSLLKGGLRTVTGLVGRTNKQNYQVTTSVATIGIRGTEYTIQYGKSVTGTVGEGEINVCNGAGCLSVTNGESYYVQTQEIKPVLTNKRTDLPPPPPENPPTEFVKGDDVNNVEVCPSSLCPPEPVVTNKLTGTFSAKIAAAHSIFAGGGGTHDGAIVYSGTATFDNGKLVSMNDNGGSGTVAPGTTSMIEAGADEFIAWGRLVNGTLGGTPVSTGDHAGGVLSGNESFHYVVGLPTATLPATGTVNYSLLAATTPTFSSGSGAVSLGVLQSLSMATNFGTGASTFNMQVRDPSANVMNATGSFSIGSTFSASGLGTGPGCSGSCSVLLNGFFAGANAERVGVSYQVNGVICSFFSCTGVGVAALQR